MMAFMFRILTRRLTSRLPFASSIMSPWSNGSVVSDIRRALKPGGFIVIFEHNPLNPLTMRVVNRCEFDRDAILLRSTTCEALVKDGRFGRVETRFILNVPPFNRVMRATDARLSKLPIGAQYYTAGQK